jgi:hypothetical protein
VGRKAELLLMELRSRRVLRTGRNVTGRRLNRTIGGSFGLVRLVRLSMRRG